MPRHTAPLYARYLVNLVRPFPNFGFSFIRPARARAVALMNLRPGARVLDLGCGMGGSFEHLLAAVGPAGEVLGVEIDAGSASQAQRRIDKNRWTNVRVVVSSAETILLEKKYDAVLMFAASTQGPRTQTWRPSALLRRYAVQHALRGRTSLYYLELVKGKIWR